MLDGLICLQFDLGFGHRFSLAVPRTKQLMDLEAFVEEALHQSAHGQMLIVAQLADQNGIQLPRNSAEGGELPIGHVFNEMDVVSVLCKTKASLNGLAPNVPAAPMLSMPYALPTGGHGAAMPPYMQAQAMPAGVPTTLPPLQVLPVRSRHPTPSAARTTGSSPSPPRGGSMLQPSSAVVQPAQPCARSNDGAGDKGVSSIADLVDTGAEPSAIKTETIGLLSTIEIPADDDDDENDDEVNTTADMDMNTTCTNAAVPSIKTESITMHAGTIESASELVV